MQFCPKCKKQTMIYVHSLREACCTNGTCMHALKFETYNKCQEALTAKRKRFAKSKGGSLMPLTVSRDALNDDRYNKLEVLAKDIHEEFSRSSVEYGIIEAEDYTPYDELPGNLQDALLDLAVFIDERYSGE